MTSKSERKENNIALEVLHIYADRVKRHYFFSSSSYLLMFVVLPMHLQWIYSKQIYQPFIHRFIFTFKVVI